MRVLVGAYVLEESGVKRFSSGARLNSTASTAKKALRGQLPQVLGETIFAHLHAASLYDGQHVAEPKKAWTSSASIDCSTTSTASRTPCSAAVAAPNQRHRSLPVLPLLR